MSTEFTITAGKGAVLEAETYFERPQWLGGRGQATLQLKVTSASEATHEINIDLPWSEHEEKVLEHIARAINSADDVIEGRDASTKPILPPTILAGHVDAALDAYFPGEDWRKTLGHALDRTRMEMLAALEAARDWKPEAAHAG